MEIGFGKDSLLMQSHEVCGCWIKIVLLTESIHAYLLEFDNRYYLYIDNTREYNGKAEFIKEFDEKAQALQFMHEFWNCRAEVQEFKDYYNKVKDKKASEKQIASTKGLAVTFSDATWYFAKRTCYFRMKNIIIGKKGMATKKRNSELKRLLMEDDTQ